MEGGMTPQGYCDEFPSSLEQERDNIEVYEVNGTKTYTAISGTRSEWKPSLKAEFAVHVALAIGASSFLVFALLAASTDQTYPGFNIKYKPNNYVPGGFRNPLSLNVLFYPNGTISMPLYNETTKSVPGPFPSTDVLNYRLREVAKLGPTLFPILFAGIVGSTFRLLARWKAEKGSSIQDLEILLGSTSLASTLSTLFGLGVIGRKEIGLILLWALSPLAGQASLRVLDLKNITSVPSITFPWVVYNPGYVYDIGPWNVALAETSSYIYVLTNPNYSVDDGTDDLAAQDAYGNPLIPTVPYDRSWSQNSSFSQSPLTGQPLNYTALFGLSNVGPIALDLSSYDSNNSGVYPLYDVPFYDGTPLPFSTNSTITFTTNYFEFNCPSMSHSTLLTQAKFGSGFFLDTNFTLTSQFGLDNAQSVAFGSFGGSSSIGGLNVTIWSCMIYSVTRNMTIIHQDIILPPVISSNRSGVDIIQSIGPATISSTTPFTNQTLAADIFGRWAATDPASASASSFTEAYIAWGYAPVDEVVDLSSVDNITFATRLTTMFNTYIQLLPLPAQDMSGYADNPALLTSVSSTPLKFSPFAVASCNWIWFTILTLASTLLIFCACFSIWLTVRLSAPDLFGYVSSSTIDNPYMNITHAEFGLRSNMNGLERSKKLRNVKVQIRDVQEREKFSKFALTSDVRERPKTRWGRKFI